MSDVNLPSLVESNKSRQGLQFAKPMAEINEAYATCKFGWFHIRLLAVAFVGFVANVLVSTTTSYLLPNAECDLKMSLVQKGLLNAIPYSGMLLSTVIAGFLTDTFGRKTFVTLGFAGMFIFMAISGSSQTYEVLITAKFFEGILFATSFSAAVSLTSEFCHSTIRDRVLICQSSFVAMAQIVIAIMSWGVLTQDWRYSFFGGRFVLNTWNFYLYLMSLWSLLSFFLYVFLIPESPKFLITQNKLDEARKILIKMYTINTGKPADTFPHQNIWQDKPKEELKGVPEEKIGFKRQIVAGLHNVKPMFRRPLVIYLLTIGFSNFLVMGLYNVLRLWFPQLSSIVEHYNADGTKDLCGMLDNYTNHLRTVKMNATHSDVCVSMPSGMETYIYSIIVGGVCLCPFFISGILVNKVGKKMLLIIAGAICTVVTVSIQRASSKAAIVSMFSVDIAVSQVMLSLNQALTIELFPTTSRTLAVSIIMVTGRIGTLAGNIIFPVLLDMGCVIPFYTMTGMVICVTMLSMMLPKKKQ